MEEFMYYLVMIVFAAVAILFFVYPFKNKFSFGETVLYIAIGAFFAAIAVAMLVKNGILIEVMLGIMLGGATLMCGLSWIKDVFVHHIPVDGVLRQIHCVRSHGRHHYEMDFYVPEKLAEYRINYVSSDRKFTVGETYRIYIGEKKNTAYIHRLGWFLGGVLVSFFGVMWFAVVVQLIMK